MISENFCTGCGSCACTCPQKAICMIKNEYGELTPQIDTELCNGCNLCKFVCPQNKPATYNNPSKCYVAWSKDSDDCKNSASAGIAAIFARHQLNNAAYIYGCDFDEHMTLKHFRLDSTDQIKKIRGSKYTQSISYPCFADVKELLQNNNHVVFISTPCQVAGLLKYLNRSYDNLITVDLICHGTPPVSYLKEHLKNIGITLPVTKIGFRGGEYDKMLTVYKNDELVYKSNHDADLYYTSFYANIISMKSCYFCQYAKGERISDITIGDFWGLKGLDTIDRISDRPSIILVNTDKGNDFFEKIKDDIIYEERTVEEGIKGNGRLNSPPGMSFEAKLFRFFYKYLGFTNSVKYVNRYTAYIKRISIKKILLALRKKVAK